MCAVRLPAARARAPGHNRAVTAARSASLVPLPATRTSVGANVASTFGTAVLLFVLAAPGAGCGSNSPTAMVGSGGSGQAGADGGPGGPSPTETGSGGSAGGAGTATGGSDSGGSAVAGAGGAAGIAGATSSGGSAGGHAGQPAASGGAGGHGGAGVCGAAPCTEGAVRCSGAAPQICRRDSLGCVFWDTPPNQPAVCSANQTCDSVSGMCRCNDDPRCGTPPAGGDFCPIVGAPTHATCNLAADGCFTVSTETPCATGLVCDTSAPGLVVPTGTACGCAQPIDDQTGQRTALLGTACTAAQAAAGARVGSPIDRAVLICRPSGTCDTWQVLVACQAQQLTGGTDPVTSRPACVCPRPATAGHYYVDPDPAMSTFMTGQPTGVQFPSACRFRTLTTALAQPDVTQVIAAHESSSNVHFKTLRGTPAVSNCSAPNSCERFPMEIPAGVHVFTTDEGSFNPAHYVIDVDATTTKGYALLLNDRAFLQGFTIDAGATNPSGVNAGTRVAAVVTSPILGGWAGTPAAAPVTARLEQVLILANATAPAATQTALLLQGQASWTASFLTIAGGAGTKRGIVLDHATDPIAGTTAALSASHLNVSVTGGTGQVAIELGSNGRDNGVAGVPGPASADAGNVLTVTNDVLVDGASAPTPHRLNVGAAGVGLHLFHGTAALAGVDITGGPQGFTGVQIDRSNAPRAAGATLKGGSIAAAGATGGVGVVVAGGFATLDGAHVTGADGWTGVVVRQSAGSASLAGDLTLTGSAAAPTIIDVATPLGMAAAPAGIVVGLGDEQTTFDVTAPPASVALPRLTIDDNTLVTRYVDGLVINSGHVMAAGGNVRFTGNLRDGLQVLSSLALTGTDPNDPAARATFVGTSFSGNGRAGILLRDVVPVLLDGVTVSGNGQPFAGSALPAFPDGTGGIDVQRSQLAASGGAFPAVIVNSTVAGNVGCGITLSGGGDDLVNRTTPDDGVRVCGLGTGFTIDGAPAGSAAGRVAGAQPGVRPGDVTTELPAPLGIFGGRTNVGGKVSAFIKNTHVQNNSGVGIYVTEARDLDPTLTADDVTDVSLQNNVVTGNLMVVAPTGFEPVAGGIYFVTSNLTSTDATGTRAVEVSDLGCEDPQDAAVNHVVCTRVRMSSFLGNTVSCNGRAQMAFGLPQRISTSASGVSPQGDWDISSDGTIVGLDLTMRCADAASPNTLAGYSSSAANIGLGVPGLATTTEGVSLVHVGAYGVKWNAGTILAGGDYAPGLARPPQGNGDFATWGVCPDVMPATCPIAPTAP